MREMLSEDKDRAHDRKSRKETEFAEFRVGHANEKISKKCTHIRWNNLFQQATALSVNSFKNHVEKRRKRHMGFFLD